MSSSTRVMPYRICKTFSVESGHLLTKHSGACRFPHGHSRVIEVILESETLDQNDMVCDFKTLKESVGPYLDRLDHAICLNTADPHFAFYQTAYGNKVIPFQNADPTSELMAKQIFDYASAIFQATTLAAGVRVVRVRVNETATSWAEYEP
jgi:6-pyruvoyltetrahydropterin/6-carboxytetrahydropterin synthase